MHSSWRNFPQAMRTAFDRVDVHPVKIRILIRHKTDHAQHTDQRNRQYRAHQNALLRPRKKSLDAEQHAIAQRADGGRASRISCGCKIVRAFFVVPVLVVYGIAHRGSVGNYPQRPKRQKSDRVKRYCFYKRQRDCTTAEKQSGAPLCACAGRYLRGDAED